MFSVVFIREFYSLCLSISFYLRAFLWENVPSKYHEHVNSLVNSTHFKVHSQQIDWFCRSFQSNFFWHSNLERKFDSFLFQFIFLVMLHYTQTLRASSIEFFALIISLLVTFFCVPTSLLLHSNSQSVYLSLSLSLTRLPIHATDFKSLYKIRLICVKFFSFLFNDGYILL